MQLINIEGLALIGPGSEWFWSMLQFVIVAITLYGIYRQIKLQASTAAVEQMDALTREWRSEASLRQTLSISAALREGARPDEIPYGAASSIGDFWEGIGYLVREGHMDRRLLNENLGSAIRWWWAVLRPWAERVRVETGQASALGGFEWLAGLMAEMDRALGETVSYDAAHIAATLDRRIQNDKERIAFFEDLRTEPVRSRQRSRSRARPGSA